MKILMIYNTDGALYNFRKDLIESRIKKGDEILSITFYRSHDDSYIDKLNKLGIITTKSNLDSDIVYQQRSFRLLNG